MSTSAVLINQRRVALGKRLGKGGEGEVFAIEHDDKHAVKLYTVSDLAEREIKIEAMIRSQMARQTPEVAFPLSIVHDEDGRFAGFLMRNVLKHKPLHELYSPGSRKLHFPQADYRFLIRTAQNISKAVASVHELGCVIGDINQSSILVSEAATVSLIDSDSFQVSDGAKKFLCRVGVPEYTPPELQGASLSNVERTTNHDAFGLAIVIFQLLFMGRHPFVGRVRRGEIPALHESIKAFRFVYTKNRDVGMDRPPGTPQLAEFPRDVTKAFESAFAPESQEARPTAQEWIQVLAALELSLIECSNEPLHWHPVQTGSCPWCAMEKTLGTTLFVAPVVEPSRLTHPFDPGAGGFNLAAVWGQIEPFAQSMHNLAPKLPQLNLRPSKSTRFGRWRGTPYSDKLRRQYFEVEQRWLSALRAWRIRTGVAALEELVQELRSAKIQYEGLTVEEKAQRAAYERERRGRQLLAHLANYEISRAKIKGIGPAEEAALASFGIETAADVITEKIINVTGFGPANCAGLLDWRKRIENQFVYDSKENDLDRAEFARIRAGIEVQATALRRVLLAGRANLQSAVRRGSALRAVRDGELSGLHEARMQLRTDLEHLGIDLSMLSAVAANTNWLVMAGQKMRQPLNSSTSPLPMSPARALTQPVSSASCPRCGSPMINSITSAAAGGQRIWRCARYPLCK